MRRPVCRISCVLRTYLLLVCSAAAVLALASRPTLERECVAANMLPHPAGCLVSDLDGDERADYAFSADFRDLSAHRPSISIHLSSAPEVHQLFLPDGLAALSFALRDVDGDGMPDIALLGGFNQTVGVFLNDGLGGFRFDRRQSYVTASNHDFSELSPPLHPRSCECAEPGVSACCVDSAPSGRADGLRSANAPPAPVRSTRAGLSFNSGRSRAP